jgi:hypothetical protein
MGIVAYLLLIAVLVFAAGLVTGVILVGLLSRDEDEDPR